jgi:hypothetical protein
MSSTFELSLIAASGLALLHLLAPRLHGEALDRPIWVSLAAGMSVAYVLVELLPELAENQQLWLEARPDRALHWLHRQVYVAAMLGMILALGTNYLTIAREKPLARFWINTSWAALHSLIVGAVGLQINRVDGVLLALVAFGAHFLVNDHSLLVHGQRAFARYGRWVLAAAVMVGWAMTAGARPHVIVIAGLLGILSGSIILTVIKEELPEEGQHRFPMFVFGAVTYAMLLLAMDYIDREG